MRMKTQHTLAVLLSLVLLLALVPAGWAMDFEQQCSITVQPAVTTAKHEDGTAYVDDINASSTPFVYDLYRVAYAKEVAGFDTYDYTLIAPFTNLDIKANDPTQRNAKFWTDLAQKAAKIALGLEKGTSQINPIGHTETYTGNPMGTAFKIPGYTVSEGTAAKTVSAGLYLVIARSSNYAWNKTAEYVVEDGDTITTQAHSDRYDYYYAPQLISVPTKEPVTEGKEDVIKTSNPGAWDYAPTAVLKPILKPQYGTLKIKKTLTNYADLSKDGSYFEPMTFTFYVDGRDEGGKPVYQKVVALSVNSPVDEEVVATLTDIPLGTIVTVTETYSGAHADSRPGPAPVVVQAPKTVTAADGTATTVTAEVSFTNDNNNTHRGGHGVENKFEFNKNTGNWQWIANGEKQSGTSWSEVQGQ